MTTLDNARPAVTAEPQQSSPPPSNPRWVRWALAALLGLTAILYLFGLAESGWANAFYSAAAQAGADNWTAWLFGSSDLANSITVDKPPASIWMMALSVKMFGLNSWSLLVPQALMGVASVAVLYLAVRRWYGPVAGLVAGAVLAVTPVAVLMFRFNNPDALLVLLLLTAAYAMVRAIEVASVRWIAVAGALVGFAFLTKSLQAFLVLPAFVAAYAVAAPTGLGRRVRDLFVAAGAMIVAGGWWVLLVELWPADSRPYIGGSQTNSAWELIMGYNGLGRITGDEVGSVVPGGGPGAATGGGMWGDPSWHRLFDAGWAGGIAWLLPAAVILAGAGFWFTRRDARTSPQRAGLILWTGWLLVTAVTFSFASGIIHEYYAVALAPAIAAVVAIGATLLWQRRAESPARMTLAGTIALSGLYAAWLLVRAGSPYSTVGLLVAVTGMAAAALIAVDTDERLSRAALVAAGGALLIGPLLFSLHTAATSHTGSLPSAGPTLAGAAMRGGPGGPGAPNGPGGPGGGGLLDATTPSTELTDLLTQDAADYTWIAAAVGSQNGAGYQLATGYSVMPIGGFNGSDPSPTLAQFQQQVADGDIHWFIASAGGPGGPGGSRTGSAQAISDWVEQSFTATTVDGVTLYDLTTGT